MYMLAKHTTCRAQSSVPSSITSRLWGSAISTEQYAATSARALMSFSARYPRSLQIRTSPACDCYCRAEDRQKQPQVSIQPILSTVRLSKLIATDLIKHEHRTHMKAIKPQCLEHGKKISVRADTVKVHSPRSLRFIPRVWQIWNSMLKTGSKCLP